jgi:hypothetical protein
MLSWPEAVGLGALGGLVVEIVFAYRRLSDWQQARHAAAAAGKRSRPTYTRFIDPGPDLSVAFSRALLGALAGLLLRSEVTGVYAALTVGASAPALLAGLGKAVSPADVTPVGQGGNAEPVTASLAQVPDIPARAGE